MQFGKFTNKTESEVSYSLFEGKEINEYNIVISSVPGKRLNDQTLEIREAFLGFLSRHKLQQKNILFQRIFASDMSNQSEELKEISFSSAVSYVQQPPLNNGRISTWIILLQAVNSHPLNLRNDDSEVIFAHNGYSHLFRSQMNSANHEGSYSQTEAIFHSYIGLLNNHKLTLVENCIRTWIFVRDIDSNYNGMVNARNKVFTSEGLTPDTHYIASTGIEGQTLITTALVMMDAYAVGGLDTGQITYLKASENLSYTHDYGVAFERGTAIDYGDRRQIFISGTASIDRKGEILYPGDIEKQTERVFDNIKALLMHAEAGMDEVNSMIVYLRDRADTLFIENYLALNYPQIPTLLVQAPVCRSGWLIEVECTAVKTTENKRFRNF